MLGPTCKSRTRVSQFDLPNPGFAGRNRYRLISGIRSGGFSVSIARASTVTSS